MGAFTGTLNSNEIYAAISNMIISQEVFPDNIAGTFASLVDKSRVEGTLYGDQKLYYATDILKSHAWLGDNEAQNLLSLDRADSPSVQAIELNVFRQIRLTVDYYLTKRAWANEGAFSSFTSVMLGWIRDTKRVYDSTTFNAFIGTNVSQATKGTISIQVPAGTDTTSADLEGAARLEAETIAEQVANLLIELKDVSRDFNDYGYVRSYDLNDIVFVWNSAWINKIRKVDLPTMFHKEGLVDKFEEEVLPARYFGTITTAQITVAAGDDYRALEEQDITVGGTVHHIFAGDKFPVGAVVAAGDAYAPNANIICKVMHRRSVPFMSAFEAGTSFFNPRSLTENHYLTWGHNTLEHLKNYPFLTVIKA